MVKWLKGKIDEKLRASPSLPSFRDRLSQGGELAECYKVSIDFEI